MLPRVQEERDILYRIKLRKQTDTVNWKRKHYITLSGEGGWMRPCSEERVLLLLLMMIMMKVCDNENRSCLNISYFFTCEHLDMPQKFIKMRKSLLWALTQIKDHLSQTQQHPLEESCISNFCKSLKEFRRI